MEQSFSFLEAFNNAYESMSWLETVAVIAGLIYVILAAKENIWCWFFGILNAGLSIYLFYTGKLYAEALLYCYYVFAGFYGWYVWQKSPVLKGIESQQYEQKISTQIHTWNLKEHLIAISTGIVLSIFLGLLLRNYTDAQIPMLDAFTTIFSFIATYMVTRKVLENWLYWIVIDILTTGMYFYKAYYLYSLLMIIYTLVAIFGFVQWRYLLRKVK